MLPVMAYSQDLVKKTLTGVDGTLDNFIKYGHKNDLESSGSITNRWHGIDATITAGAAETNKMHFKLYPGTSDNTPPITIMTLQGNRKVGINFPNPNSTLTVYDGGPVGSNQFELRSNHLRNPERYFMKNIIYGTGNEDITFFLRHDGQMFVDGSVGIGTTTPVSKLDLGNNYSNPSTFPNKITLWSGGANNYFGFGISTASLDYFSQGKHRFFVGYNGSPGIEVFTLESNGNAALQGKFEAKEIKVTLTPTADFVFEHNYHLPTLESVEKHIKEKRHLPEIASAQEMTKEGVNVGEFQIKLLQKIEELTLYTIEQNKQNKEQTELIKNLQKENNALQLQIEEINQKIAK